MKSTDSIISIRLFSYLKEKLGLAEIELDARDVHTVEDVFRLLEERYEDIVKMRPFIRVAINHEYAVIEDVIKPGDELALITPVSGG